MVFESRVLIPGCALALVLVGGAGLSAGAEVHKCKNKDGATVYQQEPCAKTGATGGKLDVTDPTQPRKSDGKGKAADGAGKSMTEAFQRRMENRDYEGALAFATTDAQKAQARKSIARKNEKCGSLSIKVKKTQADLRPDNARSKAAADAAAAEYALHCR